MRPSATGITPRDRGVSARVRSYSSRCDLDCDPVGGVVQVPPWVPTRDDHRLSAAPVVRRPCPQFVVAGHGEAEHGPETLPRQPLGRGIELTGQPGLAEVHRDVDTRGGALSRPGVTARLLVCSAMSAIRLPAAVARPACSMPMPPVLTGRSHGRRPVERGPQGNAPAVEIGVVGNGLRSEQNRSAAGCLDARR